MASRSPFYLTVSACPIALCWCVAGRRITKNPEATEDEAGLERLQAFRSHLIYQVEKAEQEGAFTFPATFSGTRHRLYIRPCGLYAKLKEELLRKPTDAEQPHGVLIWGGRGMGKTSLARDIVCEVAFDKGTCHVVTKRPFTMRR